jgi:hypothetical protein
LNINFAVTSKMIAKMQEDEISQRRHVINGLAGYEQQRKKSETERLGK